MSEHLSKTKNNALRLAYDKANYFVLEFSINDVTRAFALYKLLQKNAAIELENSGIDNIVPVDYEHQPIVDILKKYNAVVGREIDVCSPLKEALNLFAKTKEEFETMVAASPGYRGLLHQGITYFHVATLQMSDLFRVHADLSGLRSFDGRGEWLSVLSFKPLYKYEDRSLDQVMADFKDHNFIRVSENSSMDSCHPEKRDNTLNAIHLAETSEEFIQRFCVK